uniref:Uncharacterized protein n=1 Tax=Emiliania huxleyi (strain CCMP1516) TaxID=280463 RepID=A0A0D3KK88_EMIH1
MRPAPPPLRPPPRRAAGECRSRQGRGVPRCRRRRRPAVRRPICVLGPLCARLHGGWVGCARRSPSLPPRGSRSRGGGGARPTRPPGLVPGAVRGRRRLPLRRHLLRGARALARGKRRRAHLWPRRLRVQRGQGAAPPPHVGRVGRVRRAGHCRAGRRRACPHLRLRPAGWLLARRAAAGGVDATPRRAAVGAGGRRSARAGAWPRLRRRVRLAAARPLLARARAGGRRRAAPARGVRLGTGAPRLPRRHARLAAAPPPPPPPPAVRRLPSRRRRPHGSRRLRRSGAQSDVAREPHRRERERQRDDLPEVQCPVHGTANRVCR